MTDIVLTFNQLTNTSLDVFQNKGWINPDGTPTGAVQFRVSASPFNLQLAETSPRVEAFVKAVFESGHAYCLPPYGDALPVLEKHVVNRKSVMPFKISIDKFVVGKAPNAWNVVSTWLTEVKFPEAMKVQETGTKFLEHVKKYIDANPGAKPEDYREEVLVKHLGADWKKKSENLNNRKFLRLFGASEELLEAFGKATFVNSKGEVTQVAHEARWVANYINMFKPTTVYQVGAVSDIINFCAMMSGLPNPSGGNVTDADSVAAMNAFDEKNPLFNYAVAAFFDMEPDDLGPLTFLKKNYPNTSITRIYPSTAIKNEAENLLSLSLPFTDNDAILIDGTLRNTKPLMDVYMNHLAKKFVADSTAAAAAAEKAAAEKAAAEKAVSSVAPMDSTPVESTTTAVPATSMDTSS